MLKIQGPIRCDILVLVSPPQLLSLDGVDWETTLVELAVVDLAYLNRLLASLWSSSFASELVARLENSTSPAENLVDVSHFQVQGSHQAM